jgi:molybdate transport system substrate-binding protein
MQPTQGLRKLVAAAVVAVLASASQAAAQPSSLTVAAASDLQTVFPELVRAFERETGVEVTVSFGSSGTFFAQIQNGAPFDLFFSADVDYPQRLGRSGHADPDTFYHYATGRLVLWARKDAGIDVTRGLAILRDARVRRIAIANPAFAPYGRAAVAALRSQGLYDAVRPKIVLGDNISQAAQLADSGNADVALLAHSLASGPALRASGVHVEVPASAHPPIDQGVIIVRISRRKEAARRLIEFVRGPAGREILRRQGFTRGGSR